MVELLCGEKCQNDESMKNKIAKRVYEEIDIDKDGQKIDEFQMFSIVSEITDVEIQRNLSAVFAQILGKNPNATPEILDQLKKLGKNGVLKSSAQNPEDSMAAPSPPSCFMKDPTSPAGFIEMIWQKVKQENIVEATQIAQILEKRIKEGKTVL